MLKSCTKEKGCIFFSHKILSFFLLSRCEINLFYSQICAKMTQKGQNKDFNRSHFAEL